MNRDELEKIGGLLDQVAAEIGAGNVSKQDGIAKLSVVGIGMRTHSGVAAKLFEALAKGGINIQMISTSEIKIAVIIDEAKIADAAKLAHTAFGLDQAYPPTIKKSPALLRGFADESGSGYWGVIRRMALWPVSPT